MQDGKYVLTALSVDHPQCPLVDDVPRAQVRRPLYKVNTEVNTAIM